jgi:signal transduction histidine kinase
MLCREIIDSFGGRIWAVSDGPDRGTTIRFALPAALQSKSNGTTSKMTSP